MRGIHRLTNGQVQAWLSAPKDGQPKRKLPDGGGLNLVRLPGGGASWQVRYRMGGLERTYSIGPIELVTLGDARTEHTKVKAILATGRDPVQARQLARAVEVASAGELFESVTRDWLAKQAAEWGAYHLDKSTKALERHVLPRLGVLPIRDITPAMVSDAIDRVQKKAGRETAAKILRHVRAVFRYAAAKGLRNDNPAEAVVEILTSAGKVKHRPALLTVDGVRSVLPALHAAGVSPAVLMCHRLIAYTAVRISNAVAARWEEFDLDAGMWVIPRAKMKMQDREHDHKVVLPEKLVAYLRAYQIADGEQKDGWLFPGAQGRVHVSREAVEKVLLDNGFRDRHTCHGWRASFSTLAKDGGFDKEVVDLALDHVHDSDVAMAYDRGERLTKRRELMRWWGSVLDGVQA